MAIITPERDLKEALVSKLKDLKYEYRPDIRDRAALAACRICGLCERKILSLGGLRPP